MTAARPLPFPPRGRRRPNPPPVSPLAVAAALGLTVSVAFGLLRWWWSSRQEGSDDVDLDRLRQWMMTMQPTVTAHTVPTVPSMSTTPTVVAAQQQGVIDALRLRLDMLEQRLSAGSFGGGSSFGDRAARLRRLLEDDRRD